MTKLHNLATALAMLLIAYLVYTSYSNWAECQAKGGVYLAQQYTCIKAEKI